MNFRHLVLLSLLVLGCGRAPECRTDVDCLAGNRCEAATCIPDSASGITPAGGAGGGSSATGGGTATDAGTQLDGGALVDDGGATLDAGATTDGGVTLDGGATMDGGPTSGGADAGADFGADRCSSAVVLRASTTLTQQTMQGRANDYDWSNALTCEGTSTSGADLTYAVEVPSQHGVVVTVTAAGWDPSVIVTRDCTLAAPTCLQARNRSGPVEIARQFNRLPSSVLLFVIVDSAAGGGAFDLDVRIEPLPQNETCEDATPGVGTITGSLALMYDDVSLDSSCARGPVSGADAVWSVTVPAGHRLTASAQGNQFRPALNVVAGPCTSTLSCVAGALAPQGTTTATTTWDNPSSTPAEVRLVLDGPWDALDLDFTLTVSTAPLAP